VAEFEAFPKIPRLNRDVIVTEKIDGTNAAVIIEELAREDERYGDPLSTEGQAEGVYALAAMGQHGGRRKFLVSAQSRKRLISPNTEENKGADNFGFAAWVQDNRAELIEALGAGRHFGEWWGAGIARAYGFTSQRNFSLFRPDALPNGPFRTPPVKGQTEDVCVDTVPVLYEGPFNQQRIDQEVERLSVFGSQAAPGFPRPEGVIVFHTAARQLFKVTVEDDDKPKEVAAREAAKVAANGAGKVSW